MTRVDSPVPLMHHDPDRSWITDPDLDHPKGTQPLITLTMPLSRCKWVLEGLILWSNVSIVLASILSLERAETLLVNSYFRNRDKV